MQLRQTTSMVIRESARRNPLLFDTRISVPQHDNHLVVLKLECIPQIHMPIPVEVYGIAVKIGLFLSGECLALS